MRINNRDVRVLTTDGQQLAEHHIAPTGPTSRDANVRHVLRDLSTMSRDITIVSEGGLEPPRP
jgi:hypothetical protein